MTISMDCTFFVKDERAHLLNYAPHSVKQGLIKFYEGVREIE